MRNEKFNQKYSADWPSSKVYLKFVYIYAVNFGYIEVQGTCIFLRYNRVFGKIVASQLMWILIKLFAMANNSQFAMCGIYNNSFAVVVSFILG